MDGCRHIRLFAAAAIAVCAAGSARAVDIQALVRIKGSESSRLIGMGLVLGLNGTGDGGRSLTTMRRLAGMMNRLGDPVVTAADLRDADNVAVVYLSARVPASGVREGDQVDVQLSAPMASSLMGGRLVITPILGPLPGSPIYAYAEGPISVESQDTSRNGVVKDGAVMVRDIHAQSLDAFGRLNLILDEPNATWPMANAIATLINGLPDLPGPIAAAVDQKNIIVQVPQHHQANPASFITEILEMPLDPSFVRTEARVVINERTGTIVMTGDVQISPVVISHQGLTITTVTPPRQPTVFEPQVDEQQFIGIDPGSRGGARLPDLLAAFNQLKVPAQDRIAIVKEIHRSGKLHAQLITEQ